MPTIAQRQPAPTLIRDSLPLPATFPDLPDDVLKRFPSLADWQANKDKWWKRAYVALQDSNGSVSQTVTNTRANHDSLRAQFISTSGTFTASLATEITIRANADAALATRTTNLEASVDTPTTGLLARVTVIETTYATTTSVSAAISAAISAEVTNRDAAITASAASLTSAYVAADSVLNTALGTRITALEASVDTPTTGLLARVTTIETTYATDSDVTASVSAAISAEITNRNTAISAAVSTESSARATADGFLEGKYTLKVAAGDVVTGMNITSSTGAGTDVSDITFVAANFKIYNGATGVTMFNVSGSTVQLAGTLTVSTSGKVFIGTGTYGNTNTSFYVDSAGQFSLKDKLTWDGSTLTINGGGTFSGALSAATGTFAGSLSAATGTFSGALSAATGSFSGSITSASGTIGGFAIGSTALTSGSGNTAVRLDASTSTPVIQLGESTGYHVEFRGASILNPEFAISNGTTPLVRISPNTGFGSGELNLYGSSISTISMTGNDGSINMSGVLTANGFMCRPGLGGISVGNRFNLFWNSTSTELWIDTTNLGPIAIAGSYTGSTVTHDGYVTMNDSGGTARNFMVGT